MIKSVWGRHRARASKSTAFGAAGDDLEGPLRESQSYRIAATRQASPIRAICNHVQPVHLEIT